MKTFLLLLFIALPGLAQVRVVDLTCEHRINPIGLDEPTPRFSWKLTGPGRNVSQSAYQIDVATSPKFAGSSVVWSSKKTTSDESVLQDYAGRALQPGQRYYWRVKVWDGANAESAWSSPAYWETGLLTPSNWRATWIEPEADSAVKRYGPAAALRREFRVKSKVASARVYVTSHGLYELHLNGRKVGDDVLTPGWTVFPKRLQYQVYDITASLKPGANALGALLGEGWFRGTMGYENNWAFYGKKIGLLCQVHITYANGTDEWVTSDGNWRTSKDGPIRMNDLYNGETYDARREQTGWDTPGYDDSQWTPARTATYPNTNLIASESVPVRRIETIKPVRIFRTPGGTVVADMGQNMVGWMRLTVSGPANTTVTLRHGEVLDKKGNFYIGNLRAAKVTLTYTLKGSTADAPETYEPCFTFMGFRYVAIDGFPGMTEGKLPSVDNLTGIVVHSAMTPTGSFDCSNPLVNQLQHNILWGQKGNFVDVPTDCPQRDERLGWTGDAQVFCRTAAYNMDVAAFFTKWLRDVSADQRPNGVVPFVVPNILNAPDKPDSTVGGSAGWGDVAVVAPWTMYQVYGDRRLLAQQYPGMKAWVEYMHRKARAGNLWKNGSVFGDWLFYHPQVNDHPAPDGYTNGDLIATAFYAYSTKLLQQAALALGKTDEAALYQTLFGQIRTAFMQEYVTPSGRVASDSQTAYVLALMIGLVPDELRPMAAKHLIDDIKSRKNHLSTGFLGTPYLCHVLSDNGYTSVGYDLLLQESYPSWLYPVKMGATTIWERWDGQKPDSTFQDEGMNSFNHYAYGAIGDWMYRVAAGIEIGKPGYKHILIQPQPTERLTYAKSAYNSAYGDIQSGWERTGRTLTVRVKIPANTTATIRLPDADMSRVLEGGRAIADVGELRNVRQEAGRVVMDVGSGSYEFSYLLPGVKQ